MISKLTSGYAVDKLLANGGVDLIDLISGAAFTMTGGVGGTFAGTMDGNFGASLSSYAPVIAEATTNILTDPQSRCVYTSWTTYASTLADGPAGEWSSDSTIITLTGVTGGARVTGLAVTPGQPYTASCRIKANNAGAVGNIVCIQVDGGGEVLLTLTANWQTVHASKAAVSGTPQTLLLYTNANGTVGDEYIICCAQYENKAYQTPWCVISRTACKMSIPTATIGLTAGMPLTIMCVVNTPWEGNDGVLHYLFTANDTAGKYVSIYKHSDNKLYFRVGSGSAVTAALTTATWPANTNRFVIGTVSAAGTVNVYLAGVAGTPASVTRENAINANTFIGTTTSGASPLNGAILPAIWGRVLSAGEIAALSNLASWGTLTDLTISGVSTGNAGRVYSGVTLKDSGVETGGIITLTPAGASRTLKVFEDNTYVTLIDSLSAADIWGGDTYGLAPDTTSSLKFVDYEWSVHNGAEGNILLDINDGTDFCLDEIAFPIPKPRMEWRDPAHGDGRDVSRSKYENREIKLTLQIFGTDEADLSANARALWAMLDQNPVLAWKSAGWMDTLYFDLIGPAIEINTPEWFETWIRENGKLCVMSNVEIVLEAKPFARAAEETVTLLNGTATPNGVSGMVVAPNAFKGDVPAPADVFIDLVAGTRWTDLVFGQRLNYSPAFYPIREPTVGTSHALTSRLSGDYYSIVGSVDLLDDGIFAQHGATSGNTTDWDHWAETRTGTYAWMSTEASPVYTGTHSVKVGNSGATPPPGLHSAPSGTLTLISDSVAVLIAKTYFAQLVYGHLTYATNASTVSLAVQFYNGAAYISQKLIATGGATTSWKSLEGYISPADFPAATTHVKLRLQNVTSTWPARYTYFGQAVFAEVVGGVIQAEYLLDSHEGRYLPTSSISFDASATYDDVTLQALLATSSGVELTPSISPQVIDTGDPNTKFVDMSTLPARPSVLSIPSHRISNLADKSDIEQIIRLSIDPQNLEDFWYDYIGIVPIDRAYSEVRNWANSDHLILDGRSSQLALQSLSGTLDDAMIYPMNSQKGDCSFVADPDGFNGTIIALVNVAGDYQVTSVIDVTMKYFPLYLIVPEG